MAGFGTSFDPNTTPDTGNGGGGLHPAGIFEFEMIESDVKATKGGTGLIAAFTAAGTGNSDAPEDNKGRRVWANFNIKNKSAQAQSIGQSQLAALYEACGGIEQFKVPFEGLEDSSIFEFRPFWAEVIHKPRMAKGPSGKYDQPQFNDDGSPKMQAEFKRFMFDGMEELAAKAPPATKAAPVEKPAAAAPATRSRPWTAKA